MAITLNGGTGVITGVSVGGLPDGIVDSGTLATNSVDSAELIDGAIDTSHLASGVVTGVKQVVHAGLTTTPSTSSTTLTATGLTASITPSATTSKIQIHVHLPVSVESNQNTGFVRFRLYRDSTAIGTVGTGASGNQWSLGAIGCPEWTGVRLKDVLEKAGIKETAVYTAHHSVDGHLSGDPAKTPISRGVPIEKAMTDDCLIAFEMNGEALPVLNGYPLRLIIPGWPGSCSQKWLKRIQIRDKIHDGTKMTGSAYRVPAYPVSPGTEVPKEDMVIIHEMPVKSIITSPTTGERQQLGQAFEVRGHAWSGQGNVNKLELSIDFGATWQAASLDAPKNKFAWQQWRAKLTLNEAGYYEVWARATDQTGVGQPAIVPGWNPKGYLNNMQHRIAVFAV